MNNTDPTKNQGVNPDALEEYKVRTIEKNNCKEKSAT